MRQEILSNEHSEAEIQEGKKCSGEQGVTEYQIRVSPPEEEEGGKRGSV